MNGQMPKTAEIAIHGRLQLALSKMAEGNITLAQAFELMPADDPTWEETARLLRSVATQLGQMNEYAIALASGKLRAATPGPSNRLAGGLKALQNALVHLIWQAKQVAAGDFTQEVDFLGELSEVFNVMTTQLAEREAQLRKEAEEHRLAEESVKASYNLLLAGADLAGQWVFMVDSATKTIKNANKLGRAAMNMPPHADGTPCKLVELVISTTEGEGERELYCPQCDRWLLVHAGTSLRIDGVQTSVYVASDITERKQRETRLLSQATLDPLTGLLNRRAGHDVIRDLLGRGAEFSMCFLDMDNLKYVNDKFGHIEGDNSIKALGQAVRESVRAIDSICRYGGDEFFVILPRCGEQDAITAMERTQARLNDRAESQYPVLFSYGVVHVPAGTALSLDDIIEKADNAMYVMKEKRRHSRGKGP